MKASTHYFYDHKGAVYMRPTGRHFFNDETLINARTDVKPRRLARMLQAAYNQGRKDYANQIKEIDVKVTPV